MRIRSALTILGITAAGMVIPVAADAAAPVAARCGAVLTTDAYLAADLFCPDGNGVRIAADLTFDLRNHTLRGPATSGFNVTHAGVTVEFGFAPLIKNGTISGWVYGVTHPYASYESAGIITIDDVVFTRNTLGANSSGFPDDAFGPPFVITNSSFDRNSTAVRAFAARPFSVTDSTFRDNRTGISVNTGSVVVRGSGFANNEVAFACDEAGCEVTSNTFLSNRWAISTGTAGVIATSNTFKDNETAISSYRVFHSNIITYNSFSDNRTAISFEVGSGTLTRNSFSRNDVGFTSRTDESGLIVPVTLTQNLFTRNGDAIITEIAGTSLQGNIVARNDGWGIHAPLSTDLGGNRAFGNGNSPQCVGVAC